MKLLVCIFLLLFANVSHSQFALLLQKAHVVLPECFTSTGVDRETIKKYAEGNSDINDSNFKCFVKCVFEKLKFMTEDGEILKDNIISDTLQNNLNKCDDIQNDDPCEVAFQLMNCFTVQDSN
ncbi:hypothetical protein FQR65_LT18956 [Abscondita terminalis]|nr:hypothetical protein FQR65_LT09978 [Abscondita terminalis]KAF5303776.1 hypothetical protein FQR65_LT18956 [Abscondita terminalis]